jgi:hypothetical protein
VVTFTPLGDLVQGRPGIVGFGVSNTGDGASATISADVVLPPGVTFIGLESSGTLFETGHFQSGRLLLASAADAWQCTGTDTGALCNGPALAAGVATSAYLDVQADPGSQGDVASSVTVTSGDLTPVTVSGDRGVQFGGLSARFAAQGSLKVTEVGNALLSCPLIERNGCADARQRKGSKLDDDDWAMTAYDGDSDVTTKSSSGATLLLPKGGTVRWAGLYWSGVANDTKQETLKLKAPLATSYQTITADRVDTAKGQLYTAFQAYTDVTALVQAGGGGDWWAADPNVLTGTGKYAGWSLVVVSDDPGSPSDLVTVFDGMQTVDASTGPLSFDVASRPGGPARIGSVVWEGDADFTGDSLSLDDTTLTPQGGFKDPNNFADSSANGAIGPSNTFGTDVDSFLTTFPTGTPVITAKSTGETIFIGVMTVSNG